MTDEKIMKNAQYRKGLGIAWFNATNSAIEMVKIEQEMGLFKTKVATNKAGKKLVKKAPTIEDRISYWRSKFLEDHKEYYATVIAQVGIVYDAKKTIEILKQAKDKEALRLVWTALSEDERHDGEIRKVVKEMKKSYEKS